MAPPGLFSGGTGPGGGGGGGSLGAPCRNTMSCLNLLGRSMEVAKYPVLKYCQNAGSSSTPRYSIILRARLGSALIVRARAESREIARSLSETAPLRCGRVASTQTASASPHHGGTAAQCSGIVVFRVSLGFVGLGLRVIIGFELRKANYLNQVVGSVQSKGSRSGDHLGSARYGFART